MYSCSCLDYSLHNTVCKHLHLLKLHLDGTSAVQNEQQHAVGLEERKENERTSSDSEVQNEQQHVEEQEESERTSSDAQSLTQYLESKSNS